MVARASPPAALLLILPINLPPMAHSADFYFLKSIINSVKHPIIAHPYSISIASPEFLGPPGPGIALKGQQTFDNPSVHLPGQPIQFFLR